MGLIKFKDDITLVHDKLNFTQKIAIGVFVKCGSVDEDKKNSGISHYLEHMMFKGTKTRSAFDISKEFDALGADSNAVTSKEYTCYYAVSPKRNINKVCEILSDMMLNSIFDKDEMQKEKSVILEEIAMYKDDYGDVCEENLMKTFYSNHSLSYPIIGSKENVLAFERQDLVDYYKKYYVRDNIVVSIAGNISKDDAIKLAKEYFLDKFEKGQKNIRKKRKYNIKQSYFNDIKDINQSKILIAFESLSQKDQKSERAKLDILSIIFGFGLSSRLFQKVREENGLAYSVMSYPKVYTDTGMFIISVDTNELSSEKAILLIGEEVNKLVSNGVTAEEFSKGKEIFLSMVDDVAENKTALMKRYGVNALLRGKFINIKKDRALFDAIEYDDLIYLAKRIFKKDKMSVSYVGKKEGENVFNVMKNTLKEGE